MKKKKGKIFSKPAGVSERRWCNASRSTCGGALCEACGTEWEENSDIIIDRFLGFQLIEECCGKAIDILYKEFGLEFCLAFLEDFANNPTDDRFGLLKIVLKDLPKKLRTEAQKLNQLAKVIEQIP